MEKYLDDELVSQLSQVFNENMKEPVRIILFDQTEPCELCDETHQLLQEVVAVDSRISLEVHPLDKEPELGKHYNLDKLPGFVIAGLDSEKVVDFGIRYAGVPAGHEFTSLINDIILVSQRDSGLNPETRAFLKELRQPVLLQVFVTPTCPYCPQSVNLAHAMALESPLVQAEMVEATEFVDLAAEFNVSGVPQTTINNGKGTLVGSGPEQYLVDEIRKALAA
jgi:glutaredoxin-like protein